MQDLMNSFFSQVDEVWQVGSLGVGAGNMLGALLVFLFFAVLRGLFTRFVLSALERLTDRTKTKIDDMLREAVERPLKFFFLVLGAFFAKETMMLSGLALDLADNAIRSLIAIALFWTIHSASTPIAYAFQNVENVLSSEIISWLMATLRWGVILTGVATVLQIWGIQIAPIIAGFGLFGVAVALGAQDLFKNLLGGISILVERRFKIGDWVAVDGVVEGVVEHIGFRSTRVRRFDKVPAIVPNNMFADHALVNYSEMPHRRIYWQIGLEYRTTKAQLQKVRSDILAWLEANDNFIETADLPSMVYVDSFNASSIDMMVYCFTRETQWAGWLNNKQELAYAIKQIVEDAGTAFAFPSRSVYHELTGGPGAEPFEIPIKDE
ncbi:mechanosensitive ion channel family protein [Alphaproteobacteria bacterium]|nr:mechanosensitive ion channel family protein [Alphaproteobacteria bacterium]MDB2668760.1 mechanosensitive ion channel family protein [Alphaproteobacteria bacterium]MDC0147893.1 mechanosensitive ion channel family protein [Alphaproteobacteria bacterium]